MKSSRTPSLAEGLFAAARHDRPTDVQRSRIWEQVSLAPHLVVVSPLAAEAARNSVAPAAKAITAGLSAGKMLVAGAFAGSALTVGALTVGLFLMRAPARTDAPRDDGHAHASAPTMAATPSTAAPQPDLVTEQPERPAMASPAAAAPPVVESTAGRSEPERAARPKRSPAPAGVSASADDLLLHEAGLVGQARTAIRQGRPADALDALDAAGRDPSHRLEPEELSLRVRALRLLGRDAEATRVSETLNARYPGNSLGR